MKIEKILLQNLNSLAGTWEIDFHDPAYRSNGFFAILGPSGSGKTTLLDALSLALYGRTPRLANNLHAGRPGRNEVMTHGTGVCRAEVTFSIRDQKFRASWSQRRARGHPDGNLQNARHELAEADTGKIVAQGLQGVEGAAETIARFSGLDFQAFSRSVLLAQGKFAEFLNCPPKERGPILEQITGTEIYAEISVFVHEKNKENQAGLEELLRSHQDIPVLDPDVLAAKKNDLQASQEALEQAKKSCEELGTWILWLDQIATLDRVVGEAARREEEAREALAAAAPWRARLEQALLASSIEESYLALESTRCRRKEKMQELARVGELAREKTEQLGLARQAREKADREAKLATTRLEEMKPTLKRVRAIDLEIQGLTTAEQGAAREKKRAEEDHSRDLQTRHERASEKNRLENELLQVNSELSTLRPDAILVGQLSELKGRLGDLQAEKSRVLAKEAGVSRWGADLKTATEKFEKSRAKEEKAKARLEESSRVIAELQEKRSALLEGRKPEDWDEDWRALHREKNQVEKLLLFEKKRGEQKKNLVRLRDTLEETRGRLEEAAARQPLVEAAKMETEERIEKLEQAQEQAHRIRNYEADRDRLREGEPCPLCGATSHPLALGPGPDTDDLRKKIHQERKNLHRLTTELATLQVSIDLLNENQERARRQEFQLIAEVAESDQGLLALRQGLNLPATCPEGIDSLEILRNQLTVWTSRLAEVEEKLSLIRSAQKGFEVEKTSLDKAKDEFRDATLAVTRESALVAQTRTQLEIATLDVQNSRLDFGTARDRLQEALAPLGFEPATLEEPARLATDLQQRTDRFVQLSEKARKLETAVQIASTRLAGAEEKANASKEVLRRLSEQAENATAATARSRFNRKVLFEARDPDRVEKELEQENQKKIDDAARAKESEQGIDADRKNLELQAEAQRIALEDLEQRWVQQEGFFQELRREKGFDSEVLFQAGRLPGDERARLGQELEALKLTLNTAVSGREEKQAELTRARQQNLTRRERHDLVAERVTRNQELQTTAENIGQIRQDLLADGAARERRGKIQEELARRQATAARWKKLASLIASHDGSAFRNFAQHVTFQRLLRVANRQLSRFTPRYQLATIDDPAQPLRLEIIDHFLADERRATVNLSGGETFIVSLGLALGLAQISAGRSPIDSFFLDEGFGSLDPETLEMVLGALGTIQATGKLIGLISHVPALRDRIPIQVVLHPGPGGRSTLSGPGVRSVP